MTEPNDRTVVKSLLAGPPRVVNVGLELFADDLARCGALRAAAQLAGPKVVHVQWSPPAGGNAELAALLGKLRS
jgi:hypothetical protein